MNASTSASCPEPSTYTHCPRHLPPQFAPEIMDDDRGRDDRDAAGRERESARGLGGEVGGGGGSVAGERGDRSRHIARVQGLADAAQVGGLGGRQAGRKPPRTLPCARTHIQSPPKCVCSRTDAHTTAYTRARAHTHTHTRTHTPYTTHTHTHTYILQRPERCRHGEGVAGVGQQGFLAGARGNATGPCQRLEQVARVRGGGTRGWG
jgi:hypothetical protein